MHHFWLLLHLSKNVELVMTRTDSALRSSTLTTGFNSTLTARTIDRKFSTMEKVILHSTVIIDNSVINSSNQHLTCKPNSITKCICSYMGIPLTGICLCSERKKCCRDACCAGWFSISITARSIMTRIFPDHKRLFLV